MPFRNLLFHTVQLTPEQQQAPRVHHYPTRRRSLYSSKPRRVNPTTIPRRSRVRHRTTAASRTQRIGRAKRSYVIRTGPRPRPGDYGRPIHPAERLRIARARMSIFSRRERRVKRHLSNGASGAAAVITGRRRDRFKYRWKRIFWRRI
jgi:hypothetical protein